MYIHRMSLALGLMLLAGIGMVRANESGHEALPEISKGGANPYSVSPFKIQDKYQDQFGGYRTDWTNVSAISFSSLHWNHFVSIFMNQSVAVYRNNFLEYITWLEMDEEGEDYDANYQFYPEGTYLIKEHFASENGSPGSPKFLSIMIKREEGYDPEFGNWEYIHLSNNGEIIVSGKSTHETVRSMCIDCHANMAERDYIFALNYKSGSHQSNVPAR